MATNHTQNYNLNLWQPTDRFLREEFNENSQKIDAALKAEADARSALAQTVAQKAEASAVTALQTTVAQKADAAATNTALAKKCEIFTGQYTGNGAASQLINLGRRPKAVFLWRVSGSQYSYMSGATHYWGGLFVDGASGPPIMEIVSNGFKVEIKTVSGSPTYEIETNLNNINFSYIAFC